LEAEFGVKKVSYYIQPFWEGGGKLTQTTAQRCRSETEKKLEDFFGSVLSQFKKHRPSRNVKFNNLAIFQILKLRILKTKNPSDFS